MSEVMQSACSLMNSFTRKLCFIVLFAAVLLGEQTAVAGPIDFLKRVGESIRRSQPAKPVRRSRAKSSSKREAPKDSGQAAPTPTPTPLPDALTEVSPTPTPPVVKTADGVPPQTFTRTDLPYGVPVPTKPGFVTSPYSPNGGYVDVRGYPSGIEVKDPYTGKIFRTP